MVTENAVIVLLPDEGADYRAMVALDPTLGAVKWRREASDETEHEHFCRRMIDTRGRCGG